MRWFCEIHAKVRSATQRLVRFSNPGRYGSFFRSVSRPSLNHSLVRYGRDSFEAFQTVSILFQRNVHPKFVQELLGHVSVAITLDTYSHMLPGMGDEADTAMEDVLSQGASVVMPTGLSSVRESVSPMHGRGAAGPSVTPGSQPGSVAARYAGS
jgi:hypothetical protein